MYETMFLDDNFCWTFSTLKPNDDITNLESLYCILKYEMYKRFADPDVYKLDNNKYYNLCGFITKKNLDVNELKKLAIEEQPCKLMLIGNCFEQASDYLVLYRVFEMLLTQKENKDLIILCLKFSNNEQKQQWNANFNRLKLSTYEKELGDLNVTIINEITASVKDQSTHQGFSYSQQHNNTNTSYNKYQSKKILQKTKPISFRYSLFSAMCVYDTWNDFDNEAFSFIFKLLKTYVTKIRWKVIIKNFNKKITLYLCSSIKSVDTNEKDKGNQKNNVILFFGYCYNESAKIVYQNDDQYIDENLASRKKLND
ncbi:hypothetical protein COBT_003641, partial [Conglomerata obtusa]